jgi:mRNA interferase RelE/StbE
VLKLDLNKQAADFITELQAKQARQIWNKLVALMKEPFPNDSSELHGYKGLYRNDIGEFRIVYNVRDDCLYVYVVGKRNDDEVYKRLKKLLG